MRNTLKSLLCGQLDTAQFPAEFSACQKQLLHSIVEKQESLINMLDEEGKLKLHDLLETMNKESGSRSNDRFVSGFILGVAVMMECQSEIRELLSESESA